MIACVRDLAAHLLIIYKIAVRNMNGGLLDKALYMQYVGMSICVRVMGVKDGQSKKRSVKKPW